MNIQERVFEGVKWLDRKRPGWENSIDLSTLNLADDTDCVLGQVFGSAWRVLQTLIPRWMVRHGFDGTPAEDTELRAEWVFHIRTRHVIAQAHTVLRETEELTASADS